MITQTVNAREILRNYKTVFDRVKKTQQPTIVLNKKQPQVAIVSLEDLERLVVLQERKSALGMIKIGDLASKLKSKGPKDLSTNLDKYTWDE